MPTKELDSWAMLNVGSEAANELWDIVGRMLAAEREACAKVADRLQRNAVGIELNPSYADMSCKRIFSDAPIFAEVS